jgi:glycosyltransferase involved in cell wall biosynthesis
MKILFVSASYLPVLGGLQTVTHTLARDNATRNQDVLVVANRFPRSLPRNETIDGIRVHRELFLIPHVRYLSQRRPDLLAGALLHYPLTLRNVHQIVERFQPDVVNVHFPDGQIPFVLNLRRHFRFRLVVSLHGHELLRWQETGSASTKATWSDGASALRSLLRDTDAVTACSRYLLNRAIELEPLIASKGTVVYNGIDPARFDDRTPHHRLRPYILAFGRLTYKKGFDLLLEAFARLAGRFPNLDLLLVGEGDERTTLEEQVQRLGIATRVEFHNRATQDGVVKLLNGCRLLVVPSREEPFGIVALEGLAAGKPVLATRVGGLPEVVPVPPNLLVEPSVEGLQHGLEAMLGATIPSTEDTNREVAQRFTWNRMFDAYRRVYAGTE